MIKETREYNSNRGGFVTTQPPADDQPPAIDYGVLVAFLPVGLLMIFLLYVVASVLIK